MKASFFSLLLSTLFFSAQAQVFVTIPPYVSLVEEILGKGASVNSVLDGNTDMHTFDLSLKKSHALASSSCWIFVGEPFEERFASVLKENNPSFTALDLRTCIDPIREGHGKCCAHAHGVDPHHWLSPKQMLTQVDCMGPVLSSLFPEKKEEIAKNCEELREKLRALDKEVEGFLLPIKGKTLFVSHPAFAYLARDYGFKQLGIEQEGKEPTANKLKQLIDVAKEQKVRFIYSVRQHSIASASFLAGEVGAKVIVLDPMEKEYFPMMRVIAKSLGSSGDK